MKETLEQLLVKVQGFCTEDGDCWRWTGAMQKNGGTPAINWNGRVGNVRRFILVERGVPMRGYLAGVSCGNLWCVNPDHVIRTTRTEVSQAAADSMDAVAKLNRAMRVAHAMREKPVSKLTRELANAINLDQRPTRKIAAEYGVSQHTVCLIKHGEIWRDYQNPFAQLMR